MVEVGMVEDLMVDVGMVEDLLVEGGNGGGENGGGLVAGRGLFAGGEVGMVEDYLLVEVGMVED